MDPILKDEWVCALRMGKYKQGKTYLRSENDTFCCLGVLCDLVEPEGWDAVEPGNGFSHPMREGGNWLSEEGLVMVGLTDEQQRALGQLNDKEVSFEDIARTIEAFV